MRRFICLFMLTICPMVLGTPVKPVYPSVMNLDNHKSISLSMISIQEEERAIITEFTYNNNKRSDLNTTVQKHSFRSFNGNNYKISITKANEKSCHHMDEIDSYMFLNNLRKAWKQNEAGNLLYLGEQIVEDVNCNVWKFNDDSNDFEISMSIPTNPNGESELKRIVRTKKHNGKETKFQYNNIELVFNYKIGDEKFEVPEDIKCE